MEHIETYVSPDGRHSAHVQTITDVMVNAFESNEHSPTTFVGLTENFAAEDGTESHVAMYLDSAGLRSFAAFFGSLAVAAERREREAEYQRAREAARRQLRCIHCGEPEESCAAAQNGWGFDGE